MSKLIEIIRFEPLKQFIQRFLQARITTLSSSLAFHSLLSLVPLVTLGFWYLSTVGITETWIEIARQWLISHIDFASNTRFLETFNVITYSTQTSSWGWVGLGVFAYTVFSLVFSIGSALDQVLKAREINIDNINYSNLVTLVRRFLFFILLPIVLLLSSVITGWIRHSSWIKDVFEIDVFGSYLAMPLPWTLDFLAFLMLYYYVPNTKVLLKEAARAALFATPLFILGKAGMNYYSTYALTTQRIYGAFAVIPMLMLWVNVAWMIVLSGALFIRTKNRKSSRKLN